MVSLAFQLNELGLVQWVSLFRTSVFFNLVCWYSDEMPLIIRISEQMIHCDWLRLLTPRITPLQNPRQTGASVTLIREFVADCFICSFPAKLKATDFPRIAEPGHKIYTWQPPPEAVPRPAGTKVDWFEGERNLLYQSHFKKSMQLLNFNRRFFGIRESRCL